MRSIHGNWVSSELLTKLYTGFVEYFDEPHPSLGSNSNVLSTTCKVPASDISQLGSPRMPGVESHLARSTYRHDGGGSRESPWSMVSGGPGLFEVTS